MRSFVIVPLHGASLTSLSVRGRIRYGLHPDRVLIEREAEMERKSEAGLETEMWEQMDQRESLFT